MVDGRMMNECYLHLCITYFGWVDEREMLMDGWMIYFGWIEYVFYGWMNVIFWMDGCCILDGRIKYFGWMNDVFQMDGWMMYIRWMDG